jgi:ElaB/YqjD/DUF883 family membrane-anchored ribosome-binding protein
MADYNRNLISGVFMSELDSIDHLKKKMVDLKATHGPLAKEMASDISNDIEVRMEELKRRTEDFVRKNPMASIAIAFGIGYLVARIFRRK